MNTVSPNSNAETDPSEWASSLRSPATFAVLTYAGGVLAMILAGWITLWGGLGVILLGAAVAYFLRASLGVGAHFKRTDNLNSADEHTALSTSKASRDDITTFANLAIEQMPDPVILLNENASIVLSNKAAASFAGEGMTGRHISSVVRTPSVLEAIEATRNDGTGRHVDYSILAPVERHLRAMIFPLTLHENKDSQAGVADALCLTFRDLTTERRTEQMRADFVANASHELRTPLSSLSGYIETLIGPAKDDEPAREKFLLIMQDQADRMRRLIEDLLSLSRIEMNEHVAPTEPLSLTQLVQDCVLALLPVAEAHGVSIEVSFEGQPLLGERKNREDDILGDRDEIIQVFQNLIDNALKYGRPNGCVRVDVGKGVPGTPAGPQNLDPAQDNVVAFTKNRSGTSPSAMMYVSVQDEGEGIPQEHIPRLTERFYRVDSQSSLKKGSTGLGLAIVKHIVKRHRGSITIDSQLGKGSTFTIFLPRARDSSVSGESKQNPRVVELSVSASKSDSVSSL